MFLVRDIMHCKPGQVRPMVKKFLKLAELSKSKGFGTMRVMTDMAAERYWTVISETEVETLDMHAKMTSELMSDPELQAVMHDYHDLVLDGRREIYHIEK